jgi:hypothetical protein
MMGRQLVIGSCKKTKGKFRIGLDILVKRVTDWKSGIRRRSYRSNRKDYISISEAGCGVSSHRTVKPTGDDHPESGIHAQ